MTRFMMTLATIPFLAASFLACDKPGVTEQQRENQATDQADQARNQADQKAQQSQASADKDMAAAQADFQKAKVDYRHDRESDLVTIDKKISDLEAKARTATGKEKTKLDANLPGLRAQRDAFARDLHSLDAMAGTAWDQGKANLDKEYDALKDAVDKAD